MFTLLPFVIEWVLDCVPCIGSAEEAVRVGNVWKVDSKLKLCTGEKSSLKRKKRIDRCYRDYKDRDIVLSVFNLKTKTMNKRYSSEHVMFNIKPLSSVFCYSLPL